MDFLQPVTWAEALEAKAARPDAVPIAGTPGSATTWEELEARILCGKQTNEPRLVAVPVRLPYPEPPTTGSIYEVQKALGRRSFGVAEPAAAGSSAGRRSGPRSAPLVSSPPGRAPARPEAGGGPRARRRAVGDDQRPADGCGRHGEATVPRPPARVNPERYRAVTLTALGPLGPASES